jgi:2-polyprenyl-6-methoxyphenol hydroxylase-like FAD-dependent oxidoreductase
LIRRTNHPLRILEHAVTKNVLISGAGVAGSTTAYWLRQHGFTVTVVERAPALRQGGQAVDFRGPAMTVLDQMGVLDQVKAHATGIGDCTVVDADGKPTATIPAVVYAGELEVLIDDLIRIAYDAATHIGVDYLFGDSITSITDRDDGVAVTFEHAEPRRFDVVIGADGGHSTVRRLAFGPAEQFTRYLGCYYGYFGIDNYLGLDHAGIATGDGATAAVNVFSINHNTEARVGLLVRSEQPLTYDRSDIEQHKRILRERCAHLGWEVPTLLRKLTATNSLYFDAMTQIRTDRWSRGRVVLVGDAGYCAAPTSGRGTSQALVAAYTLAGELATANGNHQTAFTTYESALRGYVEHNQEIGEQGSQYVFTQPTQETFDALAEAANQPALDDIETLALKHY